MFITVDMILKVLNSKCALGLYWRFSSWNALIPCDHCEQWYSSEECWCSKGFVYIVLL